MTSHRPHPLRARARATPSRSLTVTVAAALCGTVVWGAGCGGPGKAGATRPTVLGRGSTPRSIPPATAPSAATSPGAAPGAVAGGTVTVAGDAVRLAGVPGPGQADFEVRVDPVALAARRRTAAAVTAAVSGFFQTYPFFALSDLQDLPIPAGNTGGAAGTNTGGGGLVRLRDVADVEVWFGSARTQVVVRGAKP